MGLKAGGTVRQRAERLMLLRDTPLDKLDRKHFAKGVRPAVRPAQPGAWLLLSSPAPAAAGYRLCFSRSDLAVRLCCIPVVRPGSAVASELGMLSFLGSAPAVVTWVYREQAAQSEAERAKAAAAAREAALLESQVGLSGNHHQAVNNIFCDAHATIT